VQYGGLMKVMPVFAAIFLIVSLSSIGLPGLNGFIGEFLILVGSFGSANLHSNLYVIFASTAVIFAAVYLLWLYQRLMLGPIENEKNRGLKDISKIELFSIIPIIVFIVWIGVKPNTFLSVSENSVKKVLTNFETIKTRYQSEQKQLEEKEMQEKQMQEQK